MSMFNDIEGEQKTVSKNGSKTQKVSDYAKHSSEVIGVPEDLDKKESGSARAGTKPAGELDRTAREMTQTFEEVSLLMFYGAEHIS